MRVTVVYYSLHGNTKQVALAVAETLGEAGEVNTVSVWRADGVGSTRSGPGRDGRCRRTK